MSPESNLVPYKTWTDDDMEREEEEIRAARGPSRFLKLEEGDTVIRFLPCPSDWPGPIATTSIHYLATPDGGTLSFACIRAASRGADKCPGCEESERLKRSRDAKMQERGKRLAAKVQHFCNVIDRAQENDGPKIYCFGAMVRKGLKVIRKRPPPNGGDFMRPDAEGFDIIISKTGEGLATRYSIGAARMNSPLGNMGWINEQHDLDVPGGR